MKKLIIIFTVLFSSLNISAIAQCNADVFTTECIPKLPEGFNFLKGYKIDGKDGAKAKVEYSYVFTKGTQYMINICAGEGNIVINLFDSKRNKVASSKINDQYATAIAFPCKATSIYYISYTFDDDSGYCGGSALGFRK